MGFLADDVKKKKKNYVKILTNDCELKYKGIEEID